MTPIALFLFVPPLILLALIPYAWRHRTTSGAKSFLMLVFAVAAWGICYALQIATVADLSIKSFWSAAKYVGIAITPVVWFAFALEYIGHGEWLTRRRFVSLFIMPSITIVMAFANPSNLMWSPLRLVTTDQFVTTDAPFGLWFWVHAAYSYIFILLGIALLVRSLRRFPQMYQQQAGALVLAVVLPLLANAIFLSDLSPIPYLDLTSVAFTFSALLFAWALFRYRLLDVVPVARDAVVASMTDVVVVIDLQNRIVDINPAGQQAIGRTAKDIVGQPVEHVFSNWSHLVERYLDMREVHEEITLPAATGSSQSYFDLRVTPISDQRGRVTGRLVVLRDITQGRLAESLSDSEQRMRHRAAQLETVAEVARAITSVRNLAELLPLVTRLIKERFGFYHVAIFLLDETGKYAVLQAASSEVSEHMLAEGRQLQVGQAGIVGHVAGRGAARTTPDVRQEPSFLSDPVLPLTKSETALPLKVRDQIIGVLDVQSEHEAAFAEDDVALLAILADQVASAIDNARSFERLTVLAEENRRLLESSEKALEELSKLTRRLTAEGWEKYFAGQRGELVVEDVMPELAAMDKELASPAGALESTRSTKATSAQGVFTQPIMLRGEVIGTIGLEPSESNQDWDQENVSIIKSVAERVGLALDNARLFEQVHIRAAEMAALNDLSRALAARLNIDQVLDEVYQGVSRLLDTTNFYIALHDPAKHEVAFLINVSESVIDRQITTLPANQGLTGYILRTRESVLIKEGVLKWLAEHGLEQVGDPAQSWLGVPMLIGDQVLGAMAVQDYKTPYAYDEHDQRMLLAIASQAAIAIQNAQLFEQTQARARREQILREITTRVRGATDPDTIVRMAVRELGAALGRQTFIRLGTPEQLAQDDDSGNGHGSIPPGGN